MVRMIPIQEASARLAELVRALEPGDQIVLTDGTRRVGRIVPEPLPQTQRQAGVCKGMLEIIVLGRGHAPQQHHGVADRNPPR
jgi:antitoxin (DNA-binding transcriptional repressor) of toxin-antitoxin stability system